jgi:hypothetical protein
MTVRITTFAVVPANAGTHTPCPCVWRGRHSTIETTRVMGPRFRGDDTGYAD